MHQTIRTNLKPDDGRDDRSGRIASLAMRVALVVAGATVLAAPAHAADTRTKCDVAFDIAVMPEAVVLGFLDFTVEYARPKIFPFDPQGSIRCTGLVPGSTVAVTNTFSTPSSGILTLSFASDTGVSEPAPVLRCEVYSAGSSVPVSSDFPLITTVQARDTDGVAIDPLPSLVVGEVRCGDQVTTTTTTTLVTTTTQAPPGTTTTTLAPELCEVRLRLATSGNFRRLRFDVDYSESGGEPAAPAKVACRSVGTGVGIGVEVDAAARTLEIDLVSVTPINGPADIVSCDFIPEDAIGTSGDFAVEMLLAFDADGAPLATLPTVTASDVMCPSLTTTTTTSTTTTTVGPPPCGDANGDGEVKAGDALAALRKAVGLVTVCTLARCDVNSSGDVTAADALAILKVAVGVQVTLDCPD